MQSRLPYEVNERILYNLKVLDIWNFCNTDKRAKVFCNDEGFWKRYLEHNYDIRLLKESIESTMYDPIPKGNNYINEIWSELENRFPDIPEINNVSVLKALYVESGKIFRSIKRTQGGIPYKNQYIFISIYDPLSAFVFRGGSLYGNDIVMYLDETGELQISSLREDPIKVNIRSNPIVNENNLINVSFGDITVNDVPILDLITDVDI